MGQAHLFVYGTLMSSVKVAMGRAQRQRLSREGRSLGPATASGQLYDLGAYPGLVEGDGVVHGEIMLLADAETTFRWLDAYEGIDRSAPELSEYERVVHHVALAGGGDVEAWLYVYKGPLAGARLIPEGRWIGTTASHRRK